MKTFFTWHTMLWEETYLNVVSDWWSPKFTSSVSARSARWEVGVITSPWGFNSKIISFHHQMHRRSKSDQIEERRSVGSFFAGKRTHGSTMTDCRRVEMRFDCLFLQVRVQACPLVILAIFSHPHDWCQYAVPMWYIRKYLAFPYTKRNGS